MKVYAVVEIPDSIKTVKEANEYIWDKLKRAVGTQMIELLPSIDVYQLENE